MERFGLGARGGGGPALPFTAGLGGITGGAELIGATDGCFLGVGLDVDEIETGRTGAGPRVDEGVTGADLIETVDDGDNEVEIRGDAGSVVGSLIGGGGAAFFAPGDAGDE